MRTRGASLLAAAGLGLATTLGAASPALAASVIDVQVSPSGTILAKGAAVRFSVIYTCEPGHSVDWVFANITQKSGNEIAASGGDGHLTCDGTQRIMEFTGPANHPFKSGVAFVAGGTDFCDTECVSVRFSGEVRLEKEKTKAKAK